MYEGNAIDIRDDVARLRSVEKRRERDHRIAEYASRPHRALLDDVRADQTWRARVRRRTLQRLLTLRDERDLGRESAQLPLQGEQALIHGGAQDDSHPNAH